MDEKQALVKARRGDITGFETLVTLYERKVYVLALRSTGSSEDAADLTQEVFLRAWRSLNSFRGSSGFGTWLFRITMNLCVDFARRRQAQPQIQPIEGEEEIVLRQSDPASEPEQALEHQELRRELTAALNSVSEEHRKIVLLRDVSGLSYSEIAEALEISEGTVKSRLSRARLALRNVIYKRGNILRPSASKKTKGGNPHG